MAADETSKSGVWIDTKTGRVVESQPEHGVQLVPPGGVITPEVAKTIADARTASKPPAVVQPPVAEPEPVTRRKG